jgi:hypothetical protein
MVASITWMEQLSPSLVFHLRTFGYWLANGTVGHPVLNGVDYAEIFSEPSALEMAFAIWANHVRLDEDGVVIDANRGETRAAQFIRSYLDPTFVVEPPFEHWEQELYGPGQALP